MVELAGGRGTFYRAGEAVGWRGGGRWRWSFNPHQYRRSYGGRGDRVAPFPWGVKAARRSFGSALHAWRRAAVNGAWHGGASPRRRRLEHWEVEDALELG
jgi:hypothetical protein